MVPKPKPSVYFKPGSAVEVSINGSWFSGTVVRHVRNVKFWVKFDNLVSDEQSVKPLTQAVSLHQLRPLPPPESHREFKSGDKVDAFHKDGWWEGSVTKDLCNGRFSVSLMHSKEKMVFPKELLRAHRQWINFNWVPPITSHKGRRRRNSKDDRDDISELPDKVLLHIMSFMDTKSAVRTCVLSKRWKDLCKCLTDLCFSLGSHQNFRKFVSWVISSRDDSYSLLSLAIDNYLYLIEPEFVDRVISYALFHNVQQLKVDIFLRISGPNAEFLPSIFCCQSLKSLELSIRLDPIMLILPKSLYMPTLKSLHLSYVRFTANDNEYAEPFSNCPVLNTLVLRHCSLHNDKQVLRISNPTLSSLTIFEGQTFQIELSTPNLSSFTIKGSVSHQLFSTCNFSFLGEVNIIIYGDETSWDEKSSIIIRWLQVLANVKILTLSFRAYKIILRDLSNPSSMRPQPPCFVRLESLKVKRQFFANISDEEVDRVVEYLLQNSPMARVDVITDA